MDRRIRIRLRHSLESSLHGEHYKRRQKTTRLIHFILTDQISCRSYVGGVYRMRSLAVSYSLYENEHDVQQGCSFFVSCSDL